MANPILRVENLHKRFGAVVATDALSLSVEPGEIHAIIGPNGAGKTTLVAQLSGMLRPDKGSIHFDGRNITNLTAPQRSLLGLARSFQITSIFPDMSTIDNVALAIQAHAGHSFRFWRDARRDASLRDPARQMLERVGLTGRAEILAGNLAHGEKRQLEIAMAIATEPKLLLLDEPMAGTGSEDSQRMTRFLDGIKGRYSMLLIEHDMDAVFALADRITVLVYGRAIATGSPEEIRSNEEVRHAYLGDEMETA